MATAPNPLPVPWLDALRAIAADPRHPMGRSGGVNASVFRALEARGLVERNGVNACPTAEGWRLLAQRQCKACDGTYVPSRFVTDDEFCSDPCMHEWKAGIRR